MAKKGQRCCVPGCESDTIFNRNVSFHLFPKDNKVKKVWVQRINRIGYTGRYSLWTPTKHHRICGLHFNRNGKKLYEDKYPRFFPNKTYPKHTIELDLERNFILRNRNKLTNDVTDYVNMDYDMGPDSDGPDIIITENDRMEIPSEIPLDDTVTAPFSCLQEHNYSLETAGTKIVLDELLELKEENNKLKNMLNDYQEFKRDNDILRLKFEQVQAKLIKEKTKSFNRYMRIKHLVSKINILKNRSSVKDFAMDDKKIHFYTGFQNKERFQSFIKMTAFIKFSTKVNLRGRPHKLTRTQELILVFSRLRLGLLEQDLAYRYNISQSTVSFIFTSWINFLSTMLSCINMWPSREIVQKYMPEEFKEKYPTTRILIDCTEIRIQKPSDYNVQTETYSSYKSCNTAKGLVAIAPCGYVSFVSDLYPGKISDKDLFIRSGLSKLLEEGDSVMADKGVLIFDELKQIGVELNIPPFLSNESGQFTPNEVEETRNIASLRIHIERVFSEIKIFRILKEVFPNASHDYLDQIWKVCCYLHNFINVPLLLRHAEGENY